MNYETKQFAFISLLNQPAFIFSKSGSIVTWNNAMIRITPKCNKKSNLSIDILFENPTKLYEGLQQLTSDKTSVHIEGLVISGSNQTLSGAIALINRNYVCFIAEQDSFNEQHFKLLKSIIDTIPRQIVVINENGAVVLANKVWLEFINSMLHTDFNMSHLLEKNFFEFCYQMECFDKDFHEILHQSIQKVIRKESETITIEHSVNFAGITHWMRFLISNYTLNGSTYCVLILNDITEQKHYQDQIKQQRDTFQKYIDIAPYMIVVLDAQGNITLVNRKACEISQYSSDELIGNNWFDLCVPQDIREDVRSVFYKIIQGELPQAEFYENPIQTKSGQLKLISWHNTLLNDEHGRIVGTISSGEDITKKKQMEIELLKSTTNLKAIVKAFPDLYVVADKNGIIHDYQFGEEMKLYATKEQAKGKPFYTLMPKETAKLYENALNEVFTKNTVVGIEYPLEIEGKTHWREARLVPMMKDRVLAVVRDVTKRKETEIALAESEKRYRNLVNRIPAAVVEMNVNGDIVFVNEYFTNLTGYALENLKGTHWFRNILHPHEDKRKIRQFIEMIQRGDVNNFEIRIINRQGNDTHITITTSNVYNSVGKLERIVCIATDITPIVVLRDKLKEMAIKDELTGLYNRRGFIMLAEQQLRVNKRTGRGMALFYIDMDNMKMINDTMGHHEGDKALIDVAGILRLSFRDSDIIGRLGGDEFAVFAIDCENQYVEMMQQRLVDNTNDFNSKNLRQYQISLSIGSIYVGDGSANLEEVLAIADGRMYQNKMLRKKQRS